MKRNYDYVVLGCGGIGSGALYWLARRAGREVLGLEQYPLGHHHGGSQDHSRIIRLTYHHADYTALTPHTYAAWKTVEDESAVQIVTKTGSVELALRKSDYRKDVDMYAGAMDAAQIPYERLDGDELMRRYPQFTLREEVDALWQPDSGIADATKGNAAHICMARKYGATVLDRCEVEKIVPVDGGVELKSEAGVFSCRRLIITAGAWSERVLAGLGLDLHLTVSQEQVTYYATPNLRDFSVGRFPIFIWHGPDLFYGFPIYGEVGTKAAIDASGPSVTVDNRNYEPDEEREQRLERWLREYIPGFLGPKMYTKSCLYTMPRDRNFVVDTLPEHPQVSLCVGAGHAYKFASLLGKTLSQMAIDGATEYPISPFSLRRPAVTASSFETNFHL